MLVADWTVACMWACLNLVLRCYYCTSPLHLCIFPECCPYRSYTPCIHTSCLRLPRYSSHLSLRLRYSIPVPCHHFLPPSSRSFWAVHWASFPDNGFYTLPFMSRIDSLWLGGAIGLIPLKEQNAENACLPRLYVQVCIRNLERTILAC